MPQRGLGIAAAVPVQSIYLVTSTYGHATVQPHPSGLVGSDWVDGRARVWITVPSTDTDGLRSPEITLAHNDKTGHVEYVPFVDGRIRSMTARRGRWEIHGQAPWKLTVVPAPCVCGAGAVGHAPISATRHRIIPVRTDLDPVAEWFTQVP